MERLFRLPFARLLLRQRTADCPSNSARSQTPASDFAEQDADQLDGSVPVYTRGEEFAHWLTHGAGAVFSLAGLALLMVLARMRGDAWHQVSFAIFGIALVGTYTVSTCYHACRDGRWRRIFRRLDHAAIFVLIAATYTPFLLTRLRGPWGWALFAVVWILCGAGAFGKLIGFACRQVTSTAVYLALGWLIFVAAKPMLATVPLRAIGLLLAGGVFYTSGVAFYLRHSLRYHHAIWHGFVLAGSACHFGAVLLLLNQ